MVTLDGLFGNCVISERWFHALEGNYLGIEICHTVIIFLFLPEKSVEKSVAGISRCKTTTA